jgi:hypothetical protein
MENEGEQGKSSSVTRRCFYTRHVLRKRKVWEDGAVKLFPDRRKVVLYKWSEGLSSVIGQALDEVYVPHADYTAFTEGHEPELATEKFILTFDGVPDENANNKRAHGGDSSVRSCAAGLPSGPAPQVQRKKFKVPQRVSPSLPSEHEEQVSLARVPANVMPAAPPRPINNGFGVLMRGWDVHAGADADAGQKDGDPESDSYESDGYYFYSDVQQDGRIPAAPQAQAQANPKQPPSETRPAARSMEEILSFLGGGAAIDDGNKNLDEAARQSSSLPSASVNSTRTRTEPPCSSAIDLGSIVVDFGSSGSSGDSDSEGGPDKP